MRAGAPRDGRGSAVASCASRTSASKYSGASNAGELFAETRTNRAAGRPRRRPRARRPQRLPRVSNGGGRRLRRCWAMPRAVARNPASWTAAAHPPLGPLGWTGCAARNRCRDDPAGTAKHSHHRSGRPGRRHRDVSRPQIRRPRRVGRTSRIRHRLSPVQVPNRADVSEAG